MKQQNFEAKNESIRSTFLVAKSVLILKPLTRRLNLSWSNWGFGMESLANSAARLEKARMSNSSSCMGITMATTWGMTSMSRLKILSDHGLQVSGVCGMFSADNDLSSNRPRGASSCH